MKMNIKQTFSNMPSNIKSAANTATNSVKSAANTATSSVKSAAGTASSSVKSATSASINTVGAGLQKANSGIMTAASTANAGIKTAAGTVGTGLQKANNGIKTAGNTVGAGLQKANSGVKSAASSVSSRTGAFATTFGKTTSSYAKATKGFIGKADNLAASIGTSKSSSKIVNAARTGASALVKGTLLGLKGLGFVAGGLAGMLVGLGLGAKAFVTHKSQASSMPNVELNEPETPYATPMSPKPVEVNIAVNGDDSVSVSLKPSDDAQQSQFA